MNEMRKLMEALTQLDESYFSRIASELDELYRANPNIPDENLIAFVARKHGDEAADYFRNQIESGEYEQSLGETNDRYDPETLECVHCGSYFCTSKFGGECPDIQTDMFSNEEDIEEANGDIDWLKVPDDYESSPAPKKHILDKYDWTMYLDNEVLSMMDSFIHKMKRQNVWDKGVELAGGEEELLRSIQYEAEDVVESYRGTGEGIGTSDINHFVRSIFRDLGEDDIWGWDKPKESIEEDAGSILLGGTSGLVIGLLILDTTLWPLMGKERGFRWSPFYLRKFARKMASIGAGDTIKSINAAIKNKKGSYKTLYDLAHRGDTDAFVREIENIVGDKEMRSLKRAANVVYDKFRFDTPVPRESIEENPVSGRYQVENEGLDEDPEIFKRSIQNPHWRDRLAAEREKRQAHLTKRGDREDDHHMRRVMTPKGKGTIYSINNNEPSEFYAPTLTASVRLDSDPGGYGGGAQQHIFKLDDLEFIDDDYNILDEAEDNDITTGKLRKIVGPGKTISERGRTFLSFSKDRNHLSAVIRKLTDLYGEPRIVGNALAWDNSIMLHDYRTHNELSYNYMRENVNEAKGRVVEVPAGLRGEGPGKTGKATSDDADDFIRELGIDDQVSYDVVDPETGELLFQPGQTKRELKKTQYVKLNHDDFTHGAKLAPTMHGGWDGGNFEKKQEDAWNLINELRDSDFYNVVWRPVGDVDMDTGDADAFADYDTEYEVPVAIKRKDGQKLNSDDHDNMREIVKAVKNGSTMGNTGISYVGVSNGGTVARFVPSFM